MFDNNREEPVNAMSKTNQPTQTQTLSEQEAEINTVLSNANTRILAYHEQGVSLIDSNEGGPINLLVVPVSSSNHKGVCFKVESWGQQAYCICDRDEVTQIYEALGEWLSQ